MFVFCFNLRYLEVFVSLHWPGLPYTVTTNFNWISKVDLFFPGKTPGGTTPHLYIGNQPSFSFAKNKTFSTYCFKLFYDFKFFYLNHKFQVDLVWPMLWQKRWSNFLYSFTVISINEAYTYTILNVGCRYPYVPIQNTCITILYTVYTLRM